jgi:hypothetical protein
MSRLYSNCEKERSMSNRPVAIVAVLTVTAWLATPAFSQSPSKGSSWKMPRTADGKPNFEGDWVNNTFTPLERPDELKDKPFFTADEAKAYAERGIARQKAQPQDNIHYDDFIWMNEGKLRSVTGERTSIIVEPANGKLPPTNAEGQRRAQARAAARKAMGDPSDRVQNRALSERCIIWGHEGPPMLPVGYNANIKIVQAADHIVIIQEMTHNTRVVPLVPKPALGATFRHLSGEPRGWWDGDTLVVENTNFTDKTANRGASEHVKVTERFTLADAETIKYEFTVEDKATWDTPWKGEIHIKRAEGEIWEYACHEGNYGLRNILSAARVADAEAAGQKAAPRATESTSSGTREE